MRSKTVILDTSSIIFGLSNNRNVFSLLSERFPGSVICISHGILNEIQGIASGRTRYAKNAKAALALIKGQGSISIAGSRAYPDRWITESAGSGSIVCTNDTALKRELKRKGIAAVSISRSGAIR